MRYLGIDYGTKRVGIAISDEEGTMAFPKAVLPNNKFLMRDIKEMCIGNGVAAVVIGESKDYKGNPNPIFKDAERFGKELGSDLGIPVHFEPELLTSAEAERIQGKTPMLDASAAAIILKSYLDKLK
jgi:putative holliday junction resolvase